MVVPVFKGLLLAERKHQLLLLSFLFSEGLLILGEVVTGATVGLTIKGGLRTAAAVCCGACGTGIGTVGISEGAPNSAL